MQTQDIKSRKEIEYGSIISYVLLIINIGLGLVYTPWILKEVGDSDYGVYTLALSLINFFLLDFGMSSAVTRFVAKYRAENNQEKIDGFISIAVRFYLILTIVILSVMIIVFFNLSTIYSNLTLDELYVFKIVFGITAFFVVICFPGNVLNGILNAYEEYVGLKGSEIFNKVATVVVTIGALICHGGIISLVFINGFFNFVTLGFKVYLVYRKTPVVIKVKNGKVAGIKDILSFSVWTTISTLSHKMILEFVPSVLGMVSNTFAITIFGFAKIIEGYVYSIVNAINGLFLPEISRILVNEKDAKKVLPLMVKVGRINQSIASILIMGLAFLGKDFVNLWVGPEYSELYYCIILVAMPYIVLGSLQIANSSLIVLNRIKYQAYVNLFTGILNIIIVYFIGNKYGSIGACVSICVVSFIKIVLYNQIYALILHINMKEFYKSCQISLLPATICSGVLIYWISKFISVTHTGVLGWLCLGFKSIVSLIFYFIFMWIMGWNAFEKGIIKSIVCKILRLKSKS